MGADPAQTMDKSCSEADRDPVYISDRCEPNPRLGPAYNADQAALVRGIEQGLGYISGSANPIANDLAPKVSCFCQ